MTRDILEQAPHAMGSLFSRLYVGTSEPSWISRTTVPLFIPYHRLMRRWGGKLPKSPWGGHWALDSGGYDHVRKHGGWALAPETYVERVRAFDSAIGNMAWAAPMDLMCETDALAATGLTVLEHQRRTVANLVELEQIWYRDTDDESPFALTLQGDPNADESELVQSYLDCWDMYVEAGVNPSDRPFVAIGSVCRQQAEDKIGALVSALHEIGDRGPDVEPLVIHLYGAKSEAIQKYGHLFTSSDSQAWSAWARWDNIKWSGCPESHTDCRNCFHWALAWRRHTLSRTRRYDPHNLDGTSEISWLMEQVA